MKIPHLPSIEFLPFGEIDEERPVFLVTSRPAWEAVKQHVHLPVACQVEPLYAILEHWDSEFNQPDQPEIQVVYAIGGGLTVDAAKYLAAQRDLPLVCLPTALSVDAFLTNASGIRRKRMQPGPNFLEQQSPAGWDVRMSDCVYYIETKQPERVIIDFEVLSGSPASIRAAGVCDLLSIATGSWDWYYAEAKGLNPIGMAFLPYAMHIAQEILEGAIDCADAAGQGDPGGMKQLLDLLALEVQLCNQIGHSRPEEGSEHYFAYAYEAVNHTPGLPHGELVGPGILIFAEKQGQDTTRLKRAMEACRIPLDRLPADVITKTLEYLPAFVAYHNLPYALAHDQPFD